MRKLDVSRNSVRADRLSAKSVERSVEEDHLALEADHAIKGLTVF